MENDTSVIIVSAGKSSRMDGINKQFLQLGNMPVIGMSMKAFQECKSVKEIVVVTKSEDIEKVESISTSLNITKLKSITIGGNTRQESVINGCKKVSEGTTLISIHDGARPLVLPKDIEQCISNARVYGSATLGVPVKDTIKVVDDHLIVDTPYRPSLYVTQTPQTFKKSIYFRGIEFAERNHLDFTDDCQLAEAMGYKVYMTVGNYSNIKITTPEDVPIAEILLQKLVNVDV